MQFFSPISFNSFVLLFHVARAKAGSFHLQKQLQEKQLPFNYMELKSNSLAEKYLFS